MDEPREVISSKPSDPSESRGKASPEQPATNVLHESNRNPHVRVVREIDSYAESHGTQFHRPTSSMFDREQPVETEKAGPAAVTIASQKTQLLAESARQRML